MVKYLTTPKIWEFFKNAETRIVWILQNLFNIFSDQSKYSLKAIFGEKKKCKIEPKKWENAENGKTGKNACRI